MEEAPRTRRSLIQTLTISALGAAGLWRFLTPKAAPGTPPPVAVREADVPVDGALVLPENRLAVVRVGDSLIAFDLACTHLGCTVRATPEGFACPCHGSRFGTGGEVLVGPAARPLKRLEVDRADGIIRIRSS